METFRQDVVVLKSVVEVKMVLKSCYTECYSFERSSQFQGFAAALVTNEVKNVRCVARHVKDLVKKN